MKKSFSSVLLWLALSVFAFGKSHKISPDLQRLDPNSNVRVIVQYSQTPPAIPKGLANSVAKLVFNRVHAGVYTGLASALSTLANDPHVAYITPDRTVRARLDYSAAAVNASVAWQAALTGAGVGVAVIDSGVNLNPDIAARVVYSEDFTGGAGTDQYGHGTHVAGIIAASGMSSNCLNCTRSFIGIAPTASIINLRALDANGEGSDSTVIAAIERAIALKQVYNIRVINVSLGRPVYESYAQDPLCQAVEAAWKAGIVVVTAAGNEGRDNSVGNDGYGTIESPGNDPYVITVGAMKAMGTYPRTDDLIASYSSKGPSAIDHVVKPDILAPGNHVVSLLAPGATLASNPQTAVPLSYYESTSDSSPSPSFLMLNGTSMATPVVSGAVADLLQAQPFLTPDQVKARLMKTAYKTFPQSSTAVDPLTGQTFVSYYDIFTVGAGYLDIAAALANQDVATGTAMSPVANYDSTSGKVYLVYDPSSTWNDTDVSAGLAVGGTAGVWGTQTVWGTAVVGANQAVWDSQAVWASSSLSGFQAVWDSQAVWASQAVWDSQAVWTSSTSDSDVNFRVHSRSK